MTRFGWISGLAMANLRSAAASPWRSASLALFMGVNNLIWFTLWVLFFGVANRIRGWTIADVALLYGIVALAYGIYTVFFGGARHLAQLASDGGLDIYLGRPRSPLLVILFSRSDPTGLGDIVSGIGFILWITWGTPGHAALALAFGILATSIMVATYVAIGSLVFWTGGRTSFFDQLFDCFLTLTTMPHIGLPGFAKVLVYTALPAGFVGMLPVEILRSFSAEKLAALIAAAVLFPLLAAGLFRLGLQRYTSGNRMLEAR